MPANDDLRWRLAIFFRQVFHNLLIKYAFTALCQRAPGFGLNLVHGIPRVQFTLLQHRVQLNLVDHRRNAGFVDQTLQVILLEVTDADAFGQPLFLQLNHAFPCIHIVIFLRTWPVHQIEINALQLELFQAGFNRLLTVQLIVIPQLGGHENIVTRDVSFL